MAQKTLSLDSFLNKKTENKDIPVELVEYINSFKKQAKPVKKTPIANNCILANKKDQTDDEKMISDIKNNLNKLSENNFDSLVKEILNLKISKYNHLVSLVELLSNKAILENKFAKVYAKMCIELSNITVQHEEKTVSFRVLIINRCQGLFNDSISGINLSRDQAIGCMHFISELYMCNILNDKIINSCILLMLMKINSNYQTNIIDYIYTIMNIVNKKFIEKSPNEYNNIYSKIDGIMKTTQFSPKDKFKLMDIMDLKKLIN